MIRLGYAQETGNTAFLNAKEFDKIIGNCMAITDVPMVLFSHELIRLYPDAKVILNYWDVDDWYNSCLGTFGKILAKPSWYEWFLRFCEPGLFWQTRKYYWQWNRYFGNDWWKNGKEVYLQHYERLEKALPPERYLRWKVDDGW
jgi:hypothetical protein